MRRWFNWNSANIAVWNKSKFPDNKPLRQLRKVAGEMVEYSEAKTPEHRLEELADVYIASAGLIRFGGIYAVIGNFICSLLEELDVKGKLQYAIGKKMLVNIEREFDKKMQHIKQ